MRARNAKKEKRKEKGTRCHGFLRADLKAYLDGELSPLRRGLLRWHLSRCAHCREEKVWLSRLGEDMRDLEKSAPRPELRARILASLPPALPMRPPMRLWRPEPSLARKAPGFALAGMLATMALASVFALSRTASQNAPKPASHSQIVVKTQPDPTPSGPLTPTPTVTPVVSLHDPISDRANDRTRSFVHQLAEQRRRELSQKPAPKPAKTQTAAAVPTWRLSPSAEVGDAPTLAKRLDALTVQMGGTLTLVSEPQASARTVIPAVPLEDKTPPRAANSSSAVVIPADGATVALRLPANRVQAFIQTMKQIGTLRRPEKPKASLSNTQRPAPGAQSDETAARDTFSPDRDGFVTFRVRLDSGKQGAR